MSGFWTEADEAQFRQSSARDPSPIQSQPRRSIWQRMADDYVDATQRSLTGAAMREVAARTGMFRAEGETEAQFRVRMAEAERQRRAQVAALNEADPIWQADGSLLGNVGRGVGSFFASMLGGADPTYALAPAGILGKNVGRRVGTMGAIEGSADLVTQGAEIKQGIEDRIDPTRAAMAAGMGMGFQGLFEGGRALMRRRGNAGAAPEPELMDVTLDGPTGPAGPAGRTPEQTEAILRSAGYSSDMFSTPALADAMAMRISAARSRTPNVPEPILRERDELQRGIELGEVDPSLQPPPIQSLRPVVPDGVTMSMHPEFGTARSDQLGDLIAQLRFMAGRQNVLNQARGQNNPTLDAIMQSNANINQQTGAIWARIAELDRQRRETPAGTAPLDPNPAAVPPVQRSTVESASGAMDGVALPVKGRISSPYGQRRSPFAGASTNHGGIDIAAPRGTAVTAPAAGRVIMAGEAGANGNLVRIDHGNGVISSYAHLDGFDVKIGDTVQAGQSFARVGSTGRSSGPHLHYEIRQNGERMNPLEFRFPQQAEAPRTDFEVGPQERGPFDMDSGFERQDAQRSPSMEEMEAGRIFEQPGGIFTEGPRGRQFPPRMSTRGNQPRRPVADDPNQAPPGYRWRDEGGGPDAPRPSPDSPSPGGGPRSGPGSGRGFWNDRMQQQMDEMLRNYEASQSRRREEQARRRQQQDQATGRDQDPKERFKTFGQKPAQGENGFWRMTRGGFVADAKGNPVAFRNHREAARWATQNEMAGDFELVTWGDNSTRVVLQRRANSTYGEGPRPDQAAGQSEAPQQDAAGGESAFRRPRTFERDTPAAGRSTDRSQRRIAGNDASPISPDPAASQTGGGGDSAPAAPSQPARASEAPTSAPAEPSRAPIRGKRETVRTAKGREIETEFEVRELRDVITSDSRNFDQARQPRDRSRSASDAQIADIAANLDPAQLRGNRQAAHGSPIIGPDGMVEVGNGRTMAIRRAYEQGGERSQAYRQMLKDEGYAVDGFDQPILVRRRITDLSDADMRSWVNEAQDSGTMRYSAPEQARADAKAMSDEALSLYRGGEIGNAANRPFVKRWMQETGADANSVTAKDGSLSAEGLQRIRASVLARAFDDETLIGKLLGDSDNNIKAIGNVLLDLAPKFAEVKAMARAGEIPKQFDLSGKIAEMAGLISRARGEGKKLLDLVNQNDMFGKSADAQTQSLIRLMFKDEDLLRPRSQVRMNEGLDFYLNDAMRQAEGKGFLDDQLPDIRPEDILEAARAKLNAKDGGGEQGTLYKVTDKPSAQMGRRSADLDGKLNELRGEVDREQRDLIDRLLNIRDSRGRITQRNLTNEEFGPGKTVLGAADPEANLISLRSMDDVETLLHEAIHLRLIRRYGEEFSEMRAGDAGEAPARELIKLYNEARRRHGKYGMLNRKAAGFDVEYGLSNIDEFIAEALTNKKFQRWLQRGTIWDRMIDGFRKVLGMPKRFTPLLDDALRSGKQLLDAAARDPVRVGSGPQAFSGFGRKGQAYKIIDTDGLTRDKERLKAFFGNPVKAAGAIAERMKRGVEVVAFTNDGRGRAIADRLESDAVHELMDHFFARPGMLDGKATKETYYESIQRYGVGRAQAAYRALQSIGDNPAANRRVADLLRYPNRKSRATAEEIEAAKKLRELFKETLEYRRAAGESIGEVSDGYFPRWIDAERVMADPDAFKSKAASMYSRMGMSRREAEDQAQTWMERIMDTYAGLDGGLDIYNGAGDTVGSRTSQSREFGKMADDVLADFYQNDVLAVASQYFHGSARRAEHFRRFGKKGAEGSAERKAWEEKHGDKTQLQVLEDRIRADARKAGVDGAGSMSALAGIYQTNIGRIKSPMSAGMRATVSWMHTWNQLGVMDRVTITSLAEMFAGAWRAGPRQALPFMREASRQFVRQIKKAPPDDAQRWAEALGVTQDAIVNTALAARASIEGGTERSQKVLQKFYEGVLLHQYTEGTRIAAVKIGREMMRQWSMDMNSSNARIARNARNYLAEVGISDPERFAKHMREKGEFDLADVQRGTEQMAAEYGTAIIRMSGQMIMRPTRAEKPIWTAHPLGGMVFSLLAYSFGFKKNVMDRAWRMGKAGIRDKDPTLLAPALGMAAMTGVQSLIDGYVRPAIFGGTFASEESTMETAIRSIDRAGLTGGLSPLINAMTGVRYQRGLTESLIGPVIGRPADMATSIIALGVNNAPGTNTWERAAAGQVYDNIVEPAIDGLAAARLLGAARTGAIMMTGTRNDKGALPSDREMFIEALAGKKKEN